MQILRCAFDVYLNLQQLKKTLNHVQCSIIIKYGQIAREIGEIEQNH